MRESLFKAYDIRGVYPEEINEDDARAIARAYATLLQREHPEKKLRIVVGGDMRLSTPQLKESVVRGLTESGCDVVDIGLVSTPTFYFCVAFYGYDGGMQISASHNPKEYNGIKITKGRALSIGRDSGMDAVKTIALSEGFVQPQRTGRVVQRANVTRECRSEQAAGIPTEKIRPFRIVIDAANGMGAHDMEAVFAGLPCEIRKLNFTPDGTFPAHPADPLNPENVKELSRTVQESGADFGIAPDGDGDRVFFLDERGERIRPEIIRSVMAQLVLKEHPRGTICCDIRPGRITHDVVREAGGRVVVAKAGSALMKVVMLKEDAVFGGESSGHYFYKFPYGTFEAPMVLVLKLLVWLSEQNKPLSEAIRPYKKYFHSGELNFAVADVPSKLKELQERYKDAEINLLDGITIEYPDWWCNVRGSNTEPLVRLDLEARSKALMEQKRDEVTDVIQSSS